VHTKSHHRSSVAFRFSHITALSRERSCHETTLAKLFINYPWHINPRSALGVQKPPARFLRHLKIILSRIVLSRFMTFPGYEWGTGLNSQIVDRCTGCFRHIVKKHDFSETGEILRSC